jgi:hypothetical protein
MVPTASQASGEKNYRGFDTTLTYTWLNEEGGHEFSLTAGYLVTRETRILITDQVTSFILMLSVAQHFSRRVAVGFPVYWYKQITGDDAEVLNRFNLGSFRGGSLGIGLAVLYKPTIFNKD